MTGRKIEKYIYECIYEKDTKKFHDVNNIFQEYIASGLIFGLNKEEWVGKDSFRF